MPNSFSSYLEPNEEMTNKKYLAWYICGSYRYNGVDTLIKDPVGLTKSLVKRCHL